jgi:hypothetical protein
MSLTLPFRPLSNYAAANWPLVWKIKLHVCLLYSLLGIGFGLVLWLATSTVLEVDKQMSTGLQSSIGALFVIILTVPIVVWIRATRHAPLLRSIPSDRFSPRFTFVILGVIAIWGGFLVVTDYFGVKAIYFTTIDQNTFIEIMFFIPYYIAVVAILSAWFSLGTAFMVFLVCLVTFLAAGILGKLGAGYVGVTSDTLGELIKCLLTFSSLAIVLGYFLRGFRTRLTGLAIIYLVIAVLVFPFPFVGKLDFIRASLFPDGISADSFRRMCAYLLALPAVEIVCWLAGKVEALPER